jgi:hypothetical protein
MRAFVFISTFFFSTLVKGQSIDKSYIDNWIKAADPTFPVDSVIAYKIDRESFYSYDTASFNARLRLITVDRLATIFYSKYKTDNYVPGKGTIYISTIKKQETSDIESWLTKAKGLFIDNYVSFSQHIFTDSKDPVLLIDNKSIHHTEVKEAINKLDSKDIYDISVNTSRVPASMYGQNSKNGLVQIWTKKLIKD